MRLIFMFVTAVYVLTAVYALFLTGSLLSEIDTEGEDP